MTDAANDRNLASYVGYSLPKRNPIVRTVGILQRFFVGILDAMHESRRRQAEREIANFLALQGGPMSDDLERGMTRRLFWSNWSPRE